MDIVPFVGVGVGVAGATWRATDRIYQSGDRFDAVIRVLSVALLTCSSLIIMLVFCEVLQIIDPDTRAHLWRMLTGSLLLVLGFVGPAAQIYKFVRGKLVLFLVGYMAYLAGFHALASRIPVQFDEESTKPGWYMLRQELLACISCVGIAAMAGLCGVSSVSAPYTAFIARDPLVTPADISQLEHSVASTSELLASKKLHMQRLDLDQRSRKSSTSLVGLLVSSLRGDDSQVRSLQQEIDALVRLESELQDELETSKERMQIQRHQQTPLGKVKRAGFAVFAGYCVYRLANSFWRIGWYVSHHRQIVEEGEEVPTNGGPKDAIIYACAKLAANCFASLDVNGWQRVIGALVSGAVFCTALSGVLRTMNKLLRRFRKSVVVHIDPFVVARIVGVYVLSIASALRINLPTRISGPISAALASPLEQQTVQILNDTVFCVAAGIVLLLLWATHEREEEDDVESKIE